MSIIVRYNGIEIVCDYVEDAVGVADLLSKRQIVVIRDSQASLIDNLRDWRPEPGTAGGPVQQKTKFQETLEATVRSALREWEKEPPATTNGGLDRLVDKAIELFEKIEGAMPADVDFVDDEG